MATCVSQPKPFLLFNIFLVITTVANPLIKISGAHDSDSAGSSMFDLIHMDRLPGRQHLTQAERIDQMLHRDMIRVRGIQQNVHKKLQQQNVKNPQTLQGKEVGETPIVSGSSYGVGEYFVELMVGTPAKKFLVIADTGSDLTWVDCKYNNKSRSKPAPGGAGVFDADHSKSFKTIDCSSRTCQYDLSNLFSLSRCPRSNDACLYDYSYGDGSSGAQGVFAHERVTFGLTDGTKRALDDTLIGCTNSRQGLEPLLSTVANGIMGLSNSQFSLPNQASKLFGQKFSYCLVDLLSNNTTSSKLFFGSSPKIKGSMQSTQLVKAGNSYYGVNIESIYVGGVKLTKIPAAAWKFTKRHSGGAIVDSGTTSTYLLDCVYGPVMEALTKSLSRFSKTSGPFEHCYRIRGTYDRKAPELEIRFVGGARFVVPGKSYLTDVAEGVKCVAIMRAQSGYNVIGNMLQQNNLWVFDIKGARLSFGSSSCTSF